MSAPGRRARRVAQLELDASILEDLAACLRAPGIHHRMLRGRCLQALIEAAEMAGDRDEARRLAQLLVDSLTEEGR